MIQSHYGPGGNLRRFFERLDFVLNVGGVPTPNINNFNSVLQQNYPNTNAQITPFTLQGLPGFTSTSDISFTNVVPPNSLAYPGIPASERAYQFGSDTPFPAKEIGENALISGRLS